MAHGVEEVVVHRRMLGGVRARAVLGHAQRAVEVQEQHAPPAELPAALPAEHGGAAPSSVAAFLSFLRYDRQCSFVVVVVLVVVFVVVPVFLLLGLGQEGVENDGGFLAAAGSVQAAGVAGAEGWLAGGAPQLVPAEKAGGATAGAAPTRRTL